MLQTPKDLTRYMNLEDRSDPEKWAWPGIIADTWSAAGSDQMFLDYFGGETGEEDIEEFRMENNIGMGIVSESLWTDEYREAAQFIDELAPACPEEPDAPDVELRVSFPVERAEDEKLPVVLLLHGAGYHFNPKIFDVEAAHYVKDLHCAVVAPRYRNYPENFFPAQINDVHATYLWIVNNAEKFGFDADRIILEGNSFGGLLAVAGAHRLMRCGVEPRVRGVVAVAPVLDDRETGTSGRIVWADGGQPSPYGYHLCWESYVGYGNCGNSALGPEVFPNHATVEEVRGMAPVCMHINESDSQRDAEIQYCQKLLDAGVFCSMHVWGGTKHGIITSHRLLTLDDPFLHRAAAELLADMKGFFDHDFRR